MMDYKQMAEIVTKEVDAILERKKRRAMVVKRVSLTASSLCAAAIVGIGVWHNDKIKNAIHHNDPSVITEISETDTSANTTSSTETETTQPAVTTTVHKTTKPEKSTSVSSSKNTTTIKTTTAANTSEVKNDTAATVSSSRANTTVTASGTSRPDDTTLPAIETTISSAETANNTTGKQNATQSAVTTAIQTELPPSKEIETLPAVTTTFNDETTTISNELPPLIDVFNIIRPETAASQGFLYRTGTVDKEMIGTLKDKIPLSANYNGTEISTIAEFYEISEYSPDIVIAVKFDGLDRYYPYMNMNCDSRTVGEYIDILHLEDNITFNSVTFTQNSPYYQRSEHEADHDIIMETLFSDKEIPIVKYSRSDIPQNSTAELTIQCSMSFFGKYNFPIKVYDNGYVLSYAVYGINSFYIGEDNVEKLFEYYNNSNIANT